MLGIYGYIGFIDSFRAMREFRRGEIHPEIKSGNPEIRKSIGSWKSNNDEDKATSLVTLMPEW